jgi:hypothetical protein
MSGGSFDYLYIKIADDPFGWSTLATLRAMAEWLRQNEQAGAASELEELREFITGLLDQFNDKLTPSLLAVMRAAEWWCSCDIGRADFEAVWQKHKPDAG